MDLPRRPRIPTRSRILLAALALAVLVPAPGRAEGPAPAEILRDFVRRSRPWSDVEVRNLTLSAEPPEGMPRRIVVEKGLPGRTVFSMEYGDGRAVKASAEVAAFEEIVVSARPLSKDRPLEEGDVCLARVEVGRVPPGAIRDPRSVEGKSLSRPVGANLPILDRFVGESALVKRGRKVTLLVETAGMRIAASGETRENAYVNSAVKAVNLASKRTVTGILVDENTVRVGY